MPFDTVEHSHKRLRYDGSWEDPQDAGFQFMPPPSHMWTTQTDLHAAPSNSNPSFLDMPYWKSNASMDHQDTLWKDQQHRVDCAMLSPRQRKVSTPSQFSTSPVSDHDMLSSPTFYTTSSATSLHDLNHNLYDSHSINTTAAAAAAVSSSVSPSPSPISPSPINSVTNNNDDSNNNAVDISRVRDILSKCSVSYTSTGVNVEAKITNATELRSLVDAFSKLCPSMSTMNQYENTTMPTSSTSKGIALNRNKLYKSKPVNFFDSVCNLSHMILPASFSKSNSLSLRQIGDACIETYFTCWVRYSPIIDKKEFMSWYLAEPNPMNTLIVNSICCLVFSHTVNHHRTKPGLDIFLNDQELVIQQQDFFFERARECLESSFDSPDRWTVVALLFMSCTAEPEKRHHYSGMAASALLELGIYPRMVDDDDDSFEKEMDTRLWWFAWSIDFYLYSTGVPKNTPQTNRKGQVDMPRICEEDIDEIEHGVLADIHCLKWWRFQADVISQVYEQEDNMTAEQLRQYDDQLLAMYQALPDYLQMDSGFVYGSEDLLMVCVRVNVEFNATRIILHMPFLPDANNLHPTPVALQSLNVCLKTALLQLKTINICNDSSKRCGFDRDELWRAGEIISLAVDVYRNCSSPTDCGVLLKDISVNEFKFGLQKAMTIMQACSEFKMGRKDWVQVNDWLKDEIARHDRLDAAAILRNSNNQHQRSWHTQHQDVRGQQQNYGLASPLSSLSSSTSSILDLEPDFHLTNIIKREPDLQTIDSTLSSVMSFPPTSPSFTVNCSSSALLPTLSPPKIISKTSTNNKKPSFSNKSTYTTTSTNISSSPTGATEFIAFCPDDNKARRSSSSSSSSLSSSSTLKKPQQRQQQAARFRYFNPRMMNKFLFIDDHPLL